MLAAAPPRAPRCGPRPAPGPGPASSRAPHARPGPAAAPPVLCYSRGRWRRGRSESKPGWIPEPLRDRPAPAGFRRRGLGLCPKCPAWVPRARPVPTARRALGPRQPAPGRPLAGWAPPAPAQALRPSVPRPSGHSQALRGSGLRSLQSLPGYPAALPGFRAQPREGPWSPAPLAFKKVRGCAVAPRPWRLTRLYLLVAQRPQWQDRLETCARLLSGKRVDWWGPGPGGACMLLG